MTTEEVRYPIVVTGQEAGARAFAGLGKAIGDSGLSADKLSASLRAASRMNAEIERSSQRAAAAQKAMTAATNAAAQAAATTGPRFQDAAKSLGALVYGAQSLSPALGQLAPQIMALGERFTALTNTVGGAGGAVGISVIAAFTIYGQIIDRERERQEKFEKSIEASTKALKEQQAAAAAGFNKREVARIDEQAAAAARGISVTQYRSDQADLEAVNRAEATAAAAGQIGPNIEGGRGGPAPFNPTRADRLTEADDLLRGLQRQADEAKRRADMFGKTRFDDAAVGRAGADTTAKLDAEFAKQEEVYRALRDGKRTAHEEELAQFAQREAAAQQYHDTLRSGAQESWGMLGSAAGQAFAAIARGEKVSLKALLSSLGSQAIASGTNKLFEAAGYAFIPGGQATAAGLAGVGAAQIAFGATLAGGAAAAGGGAGGGGASGKPASPTPVAPSRETGAKNEQPIVVNMPTVTSATAQDGKRVQEGVDEARRKGRL